MKPALFSSLIGLVTIMVPPRSVALAAEHPRPTAQSACTPAERWDFGPRTKIESIRPVWQNEFQRFLDGKTSPVMGFSQALALRRQARTPAEKLLGEYWISRALLKANLIHIAHSGFGTIAAYPLPYPENDQVSSAGATGIQLAALACLNQIHRDYPSITPPEKVTARLDNYVRLKSDVALEYGARLVAHQISASQYGGGPPERRVQKTVSLLSGSHAYGAFARGLWALHEGNHRTAAKELSLFVNAPVVPEGLRAYVDPSRLLLARAHYHLGQYDQAILQLKAIRKSSNELAHALSDLSWTFLMADRQSEAIGTAMNLQAGGLRHTFTPEAPMVMSMALNELCQYPESLRAIQVFRKNYEKSYRWLEKWHSERIYSEKPGRRPLYPLAVQHLKRQKEKRRNPASKLHDEVPDKVASEWIRSPLFIASQDELNLLFDERESATRLGKSGSSQQKRLATEIKTLIQDLKIRYKKEKKKMKPGDPLPAAIRKDLAVLKKQITAYQRLRLGAPTWRTILSSHERQAPRIVRARVARINEDLARRSHRMLRQLEEIAENNQLIEVEIYNGASQDIIWQNAYPEYKEIAKKFQDDQQRSSASKVWDWGSSAVASEEAGEIWEDELGSFKADLYDNCSSKDKFLALKRHVKKVSAN